MSSGKIKKIKVFFEDANCVFFVVLLEIIRVPGARAHFMRLYILFSSIQFISILFYSIQRDEKNETLRLITNDNENNENNENYEKKGKLRNVTKKTKITKRYEM